MRHLTQMSTGLPETYHRTKAVRILVSLFCRYRCQEEMSDFILS